MTTAATNHAIEFRPPGPGSWSLDTTHHGRRPVTAYLRPLYVEAFTEGMGEVIERYGLPLAELRMGVVEGCGYVRPMAVGEPEEPKGPPPALVMKVLSRLHPVLRRRNKVARAALAERRWRDEVDAWFSHERDEVIDANLQLQRVDPTALDDDALLAHVQEVTDHFRRLATDSFRKHGGDLVPVGLYLADCGRWGIGQGEAAALLRGSSPATLAAEQLLVPAARAVAAHQGRLESIGDVRALGAEVAESVDHWLELHGWRLLASDDLDRPTMCERPDLQLRAVLAADAEPTRVGAPDATQLRARVPADEHERFDERLAEARYGLRQRDDAVALRWNWPAGLLRRGLLEAGRRMVANGAAHDAEHAVELAPDEVGPALGGRGPSADELAGRRRRRDAVEVAGPPRILGVAAEPPPLEAMPAPLATMAAAILAVMDSMEGPAEAGPDVAGTLQGSGIGDAAYQGRACVVASSIDAFERFEAGDVLVAPFTSSGYDSLFPLMGAVVTDEGGPVSHAAIMAREFGVPAVVGTRSATLMIPDGATVDVDPATGTVTVVG